MTQWVKALVAESDSLSQNQNPQRIEKFSHKLSSVCLNNMWHPTQYINKKENEGWGYSSAVECSLSVCKRSWILSPLSQPSPTIHSRALLGNGKFSDSVFNIHDGLVLFSSTVSPRKSLNTIFHSNQIPFILLLYTDSYINTINIALEF